MKVLFTGKGKSGAWTVRGEQIAAAIRAQGVDAVAIPKASVEQMRAADVVVLVKRPTFELIAAIRQSGRPFVWDIVDAWPQPDGNEWPEDRALTWLRTMVNDVRPDLLICATHRMMEDARYARSSVIYHHARPELRPIPHGINLGTFTYEGGSHYLGRFEQHLVRLADERGWRFNKTKVDWVDDFVICLRDCNGYAPRHWKSNVKLANAQALGIPALCSPECGYKETSTGGVIWIESPSDLPAAFDRLADPKEYAAIYAAVDDPPKIEAVAANYACQLAALC